MLFFFPLGLPVESRQFGDSCFLSLGRDLELDQVTAFMIKLEYFCYTRSSNSKNYLIETAIKPEALISGRSDHINCKMKDYLFIQVLEDVL